MRVSRGEGMRTDPNPGECCVGIHKVDFPFSRALEMLGGSRWGAPAGVSIWAVSALENLPHRGYSVCVIRGPVGATTGEGKGAQNPWNDHSKRRT